MRFAIDILRFAIDILRFVIDILRIAQESIFSGLNNITVNTVMDEEYDSFFGFTAYEVKAMLEYYGIAEKENELKDCMHFYKGSG